MWRIGWRDSVWASLDQFFDLIVIGGGITGAGIFSEAARRGYKTLLVEAKDYASGTSSRSSKLVHGGFRYLKNGQIKITYDSVRERERLLREERGLINELGFIIARYKGDRLPMWALGLGLTLYDLIAFRWGHKYYPPEKILDLCHPINSQDLHGGYRYFDALTDDARLVLKTIKTGVEYGGSALNYSRAENILRTNESQAAGVVVKDMGLDGNQRTCEVRSKAVINASGVWAEQVHRFASINNNEKLNLRRLQGSHLVFPFEKLPITRAISIWHPRDKRPVFAFPWEGVTVVGTTDVDTKSGIETDPIISQDEFKYLMEFVQFSFPGLELTDGDVQSTFSGLRSVVDTGKRDPSKESREHLLRYDSGMLTVAGGKLTTFRLMANQALDLLEKKIPSFRPEKFANERAETPSIKLFVKSPIGTRQGARLIGRYGRDIHAMLNEINIDEFKTVEKSINLWAEVRWAARGEGIVHLDDLLLRRVRLGNLLPDGGLSVMNRIKSILVEELNWDEQCWTAELGRYAQMIQRSYSVKV
jgi:glycerol-3-phosphate dehydrogenase